LLLPLKGNTIHSIEQAVVATFATRQLADLGARFVKIERPGVGDFACDYDETVRGMVSHFVWLNRSKESLTLDLKHPEARQIVHQLLKDADMFVQNLAPVATERLGLGSKTRSQRYPCQQMRGTSVARFPFLLSLEGDPMTTHNDLFEEGTALSRASGTITYYRLEA
jgi:crotonobetainyl-CoA:carnitine CoA-transferase CaiB-like acyl-CoA transferase